MRGRWRVVVAASLPEIKIDIEIDFVKQSIARLAVFIVWTEMATMIY